MAHFLSMSGRTRLDETDDLVRVTDAPNSEQINLEMSYFSVPNDAAILKQYTPLSISFNGAKPQFMWASRQFETQGPASPFPAYIVSGFGLLDAFVHAYATNATLVLHPLDIILSVCYGYGNEQKRPIHQNNEELKKPVKVTLKQEFTRLNLLLALIARLARRVETFPLPKLYSLINTELSSPDPMVIRLVFGVLSYLASTKEATRVTLELFKDVFDLYKHSKVDQLDESHAQLWSGGTLDVRHDPNVPSSRKAGNKDQASNVAMKYDLSMNEESITANSAVDLGVEFAAAVVHKSSLCDSRKQDAVLKPALVSFADHKPSASAPNTSGTSTDVAATSVNFAVSDDLAVLATSAAPNASGGPAISNPAAAATAAVDANKRANAASSAEPGAGGGSSDELKIHGNWRLMFDQDPAELKRNARRREKSKGAQPDAAAEAEVRTRPSAIEALTILGSDAVNNVNMQQGSRGENNSNFVEEQEAFEWFLKPRLPSRHYKFRKDNGIHSVLFKGSQRDWVELPEVLHELCQFFMLDLRLQSDIVKIGQYLQRTRLNLSHGQNYSFRKWWQKVLFKDGLAEALPDGDIMITGWLATLLGARVINEYCPMTINKLSDLKTGVRLPVLLVRQPADCEEETDDPVLDFENRGLMMTRLNYYDEYREKMGISSSNAGEIPIGLFMPWRSSELLYRSRKVWRQVGGDAPGMPRLPEHVKRTMSSNNADDRADYCPLSDRDPDFREEDVSVKLWTSKRQQSSSSGAKSSACSCCGKRSRRRLIEITEPMYNMSCLLTGLGGFCLEESKEMTGSIRRTCVRPLCFLDIAYEQ